MGDRARSLRRTVARAAACSVLLAGAAWAFAACGISMSATGGPGGDAAAGDSGIGSGEDAALRNDGGDASQGGCSAERAMCGASCTDLASDPTNCGQCGKTCADGQTCSDSKCTILCVSDKQNCDESCVDTSTDPLHCGSCAKQCAPELLCSAGQCATNCGALSTCPLPDAGADAGPTAVYCADETTDRNNCGACGKVCKNNEICTGSACKPVCATSARVGDLFAANMIGCIDKVDFSNRARVCPSGSTVCSGQEWVTRRGTKVPSYNYWTNDDLRWSGQDGNCIASTSRGQLCGSYRATPMRVCGKKTDPVGNTCNWTNCGFGSSAAPNQYMGGCEGDQTAGTLCCTP